jgi:alpha-tubulin suppressor-like RCC1 family protein/Ca2+-binding EF-hand superfamily protein
MSGLSVADQKQLEAVKNKALNFEEEVLTDKQRMRNTMLTNRESVKEELKAMSPFEIFALFDDDDSGLVDFEEFKRMLPFLDIYISDLKAFRYFRLCDSDGSGEIDIDEFKVAMFICDPTSGNPVGFVPTRSLTPLDSFETFDEDQSGFLDEDEFFYAMEYMGLNPTDHKHEELFTHFDSNHTGSIDYYEFREVFLMMCDVRRELEDRGVDVPTFARRKTLEVILRGLLDDEERRERQAIAEAIRFKKWILAVREKKKVLQKAAFRAYQELRNAMDAGGHVYAFGGGNYKQFESAPLQSMKTSKFDFQLFDRVLELWKDRVKPEQLIDKLKNIRKVEEEEEKRDLERGEGGMGALGQISEGRAVIIDPYKEALISGFIGLNVSMNTASLWGRRVHHVAVTENVAFALAETGELFTWGGNSYWWHEIQPDSLYQTKWRGDTTARSQLLLGTQDKQLPPDASLDNTGNQVEELSPEEKLAEVIKVVSKYFDLWEPPPNPATRMIYLTKELLPKMEYDVIKFSLTARGKDMGEKNKIELMEELYEDINIEKKLLGERAHKAIRELETQISSLRRRKKDKLADKFLKRIDDMWLPLREVQAEQRAAEIARKLASEHAASQKIEMDYVSYRERLLAKRESLETKLSPRGNSLEIDLLGVTPRGPTNKTPRGFQSAIQISAGTAHAMLVHKSGQLYAWGMGAAGRLGLDVTEDGDPQKDVVQPRLVQALGGRPVLRVDCGYSHTGCIVAGGDLYMWGSAGTGKCGLGEITNTVECYCSIPTRVLVGKEDRKVRRISCGSAHTAVVTEAGLLYVFGCGDGGRLGMGKGVYDTVYIPVQVNGLAEERIINVSCGNTSTFAVTETKMEWVGKHGARYKELTGGVVFMAGSQNVLGRQCDTFERLHIPNNPSIKMVSAGFQHTCMVSSDGEMFTFGFNKRICCGNSPDKHFVPTPTIVSCLYANANNIAVNCPVEMSSIYNSRDGIYAVNEDKDGHGIEKCACTQQESQPWIEIDLGKMSLIEEVRVWNRTDVPRDRHQSKDMYTAKLFPCWVMIGRVPFDKQTNQIGIKNNLRDAVAKTKFTENQRMSSWHVPANIQGRYIRVQLEAYETLCVAEIEVMGNHGLSKGVGRVSYAVAGRDVTVAVIRPSTEPRDIESAYRRATYADAGNADILRQLETYALEYDKMGRGEVLMKTCDICRGDVKCEACALYEVYKDEIAKIPPGIGGRRRRLKSIDEFLININKPDLELREIPRKVRPTKADVRKAWWSEVFAKWGFSKKKKRQVISPEEALEMDPESHLERIVFEEDAKARAEGRDPNLDIDTLLTKPEKDDESVSTLPGRKKKKKNGMKVEQVVEKADKVKKRPGVDVPKLPDFDFDNVGNNLLVAGDGMNSPILRGKIINPGSPSTWQPGDMLLTGQKVRNVIPKSISGPASEAEELQQALDDEKERKRVKAEAAAARGNAIKVSGNIS